MKNIILIVEDLPEEQEKAKLAAHNAGFVCAVTPTLAGAERMFKTLEGKISGVVTDLHFPESDHVHPKNTADTPCGLAVVAQAIERTIPVVVCSNIDHHHAEYPRIVIRALGLTSTYGAVPFGMDSKNWETAVAALAKILNGGK